MMTKTFEITLEKLVYGGECLGRLPDGRAVFVPFVLPGETVQIELVDEKKHYARAWPIELIEPAPFRIPPRCPHFGACGGCQYQNMDYAKQIQTKEDILLDQFQRLAGIENPPLQAMVPSPSPWYYRNHVQFHLNSEGNLGYIHADGIHHLPIEECYLPQGPINAIWPQIDLGPDSQVQRCGIRMDTQEEIMLILEGENPDPPQFSVDIPISAVYTPMEANLTVLAGQDHLVFSILGRSFQVSSRSFFQVNTAMAEKMVTFLLENLQLSTQSRVIELFAGVGLFSAFLAPEIQHLTAIESSGSACHDFAQNLDEFDNVILYEAEVEDVLPSLNLETDIMIMDPPRSGLAPAIHDALSVVRPYQIAYISCDPATLARDTKKILQKKYRLLSVTPFDLFPQTSHIESISFFELIPQSSDE